MIDGTCKQIIDCAGGTGKPAADRDAPSQADSDSSRERRDSVMQVERHERLGRAPPILKSDSRYVHVYTANSPKMCSLP